MEASGAAGGGGVPPVSYKANLFLRGERNFAGNARWERGGAEKTGFAAQVSDYLQGLRRPGLPAEGGQTGPKAGRFSVRKMRRRAYGGDKEHGKAIVFEMGTLAERLSLHKYYYIV